MRKVYLFCFILFGITMHCYSQNRYYVVPWAQKLFLGLNVLYDYEMFSSEDDFKIEANSILFEIASGYDFGRVVPRIFFDFGLPLYGLVGFSDGDGSLTKGMDIKNLKFGLEVGIKPINIPIFNLTIPLGVLFCWTTYTQKNPSYVDGYPYDRIWDYSYINLFSGIDATFQLNKHFKIGLFSRIVFPVKKEEEYKETLHGNYIWNSTGSSTRSIKSDIDVLTFSIGIGALANL